LGGIYLARHDTATWLVFGETQLAKTAPRARAEISNIIGDLHEGTSNHIEGAMSLNEGIMVGQRFKLR
jgi:hypothetical protein